MKSNFYDDAKFGVIERTWFGLPRKYGGHCASGFTIGTGTTEAVVARWYPKGPIDIVKTGAFVVATLASAANATGSVTRQRLPIEFYKGDGGTTRNTLMASTHLIMGDGGRTARFGFASDESPASSEVEAGGYISIYLATANSDNGTVEGAIGTVLRTGTFAVFIDWVRKYGSQWDV
jgi:hypothetical protein